MATGGDPPYEVFRKHSANLLTAIQDPEVLAWELYAENVISPTARDAASFMMHGRGARTSNLLMAVESQIVVDSRAFDVFLSVLAKRPSMNDLCVRMRNMCGKPASGELMRKTEQPSIGNQCRNHQVWRGRTVDFTSLRMSVKREREA